MKRRLLTGINFIILTTFLTILSRGEALAQDDTIVDASQFATVLDQEGLDYPLVNLAEPAMFNPTLGIFWVDFDQLTNAIGAVREYQGQTKDGITVWPVRLMRTAAGTVMTYPWSDTELVTIPAQEDDAFTNRYSEVLGIWCTLTGKNRTPYDDLIADGCSFLAPKRIVLDVWLADVNDCPVHEFARMMNDSETCDSCDDPPPTDSDREFNPYFPDSV